MTVETNGTFTAHGTAGPQRYFWNTIYPPASPLGSFATADITANLQRENSKSPDGELVSKCHSSSMTESTDFGQFLCDQCGEICEAV